MQKIKELIALCENPKDTYGADIANAALAALDELKEVDHSLEAMKCEILELRRGLGGG